MGVSKKLSIIISLTFSFVMLFLFIVPICEATTKYSYDVYSLPNKEYDRVLEYHNISVVENEISESRAVVNFAVSSDEYVALLTTDDRITVFDESGNVYRRFQFHDSGTSYVGWNNNNLLLFSVRGNTIVEFTMDGVCVDIVELSYDCRISVLESIKRSTLVETTKYTYELSKNMGVFNFFSGNTYNTLRKTDSLGQTTILYDINTFQIAKSIIVLLCVLVVICIVPAIIIYQVRKYRDLN